MFITSSVISSWLWYLPGISPAHIYIHRDSQHKTVKQSFEFKEDFMQTVESTKKQLEMNK